MNRTAYKEYKKENPYHVWIYRHDGRKFVGHFKNKASAEKWQVKVGSGKLGNVTAASKTRKHHERNEFGAFSGFGSLAKVPKGFGKFK